MTAVATTADMRSLATVVASVDALDFISRLSAPRGLLQPDFTWDPLGPLYVYPNGHSSGAYKAEALVPLTFTATYTAEGDTRVSAVRYDWDFGDGMYGSGPVVSHTFGVVNPWIRVSLCITDNLGVKRCMGHQLLLFADPGIQMVATSGVVMH